MNDTIKIWKSNLQGLLEEVVGAVYLFGASATSNGQIPMTTFMSAWPASTTKVRCASCASHNLLFQLCWVTNVLRQYEEKSAGSR